MKERCEVKFSDNAAYHGRLDLLTDGRVHGAVELQGVEALKKTDFLQQALDDRRAELSRFNLVKIARSSLYEDLTGKSITKVALQELDRSLKTKVAYVLDDIRHQKRLCASLYHTAFSESGTKNDRKRFFKEQKELHQLREALNQLQTFKWEVRHILRLQNSKMSKAARRALYKEVMDKQR